MNLHVLALNDSGLRISDAEGAVFTSPGFALMPTDKGGKKPLFGEAAREQARLHPRQTFNQFWYQLNLEPLPHKNTFFRHQADLAHGHLMQVAAGANRDGDVLLAVPGHFDRQQLGILLGLIKASPFNASGLIDLGLLAAASGQRSVKSLYLDMQLHQSVLTLVHHQQGELVREQTLQVPGTGWLALEDAWAGMITDAFLRQARFNPEHNAETEQFLHNQLPTWRQQALQRNEVSMEINYRDILHQASTTLNAFVQQSQRVLRHLRDEIQALSDDDTQLLVPESLAGMPGVSGFLPAFDSVSENAIAATALRLHTQIVRPDEPLALVTRLPAPDLKTATAATRQPIKLYVLEHHKARPLGNDGGMQGLVLENGTLGPALMQAPPGLKVNDQDAGPGQILKAGDRLALAQRSLLLIEVE